MDLSIFLMRERGGGGKEKTPLLNSTNKVDKLERKKTLLIYLF